MKRFFPVIAIGLHAACLGAYLCARDVVTVSECPGSGKTPVTFQVDCTHVTDPAAHAQCRTFAENQACKVFFAYRKITGFHLEDWCQEFKYTLYDKDKWPYQNTGDGGLAGRCGAQLLSDFSVLNKSEIGPIDIHEILHVYQSRMGALPDAHVLFGPSMTEARRLIGDNQGYTKELEDMKAEANRFKAGFDAGTITGDKECHIAEVYWEEALYLKDPRLVEMFYLKLGPDLGRDMAQRQARFDRMYNIVSSGEAGPFLIAHGCPRM